MSPTLLTSSHSDVMSILKRIQYLPVVFLAASSIPFSTFLLFVNYLYIFLIPENTFHHHLKKMPGFRSKTILLSGINTPHGLRLARAFYETGHNVVGADYEPGGVPIHVRFSRALTRFHRLPYQCEERRVVAYITALLRIIEQEHADLWINCTSSTDPNVEAQARNIIEQTTNCHCFALRLNDAPSFATRHAFLSHTKSLGLPVPEAYDVRSRDEIHNVLNTAHGNRKYMLHSPEHVGVSTNRVRTVLPRRTLSQTYNTVSQIAIAKAHPLRLEQDTDGLERFSTFAVIVRGEVTAFVASSSSHASCYRALDPNSALNRFMLHFVQTFARRQGTGFNTHLGIEFCIEERVIETGVVKSILPADVSVQAQAAALLFRGVSGSTQLARAYLACLLPELEDDDKQSRSAFWVQNHRVDGDAAMPSSNSSGIYCFGQDLLQLCLAPLINVITVRSSLIDCLGNLVLFIKHLLLWQDDTYSPRDPIPFWWSYQIYIPLRLIMTAILVGDNGDRTLLTDRPQQYEKSRQEAG
ncbi:uncharacterized protein Z518_06236 [Rhinocladiella mackenziei CBS 650.93]|uniref:ATP-grasp domain-containing protein n=1 Tax=Rhinocladiella mackenziei CBS 650.93 TaxID=1442369 RepID=A0A0D2IHW4_9EURO|nr:uncharacterized protein Z518_06236 [Rhinocladiella mackenziei CBS 650.93]KIX05364.1 hypothetical protein Z518_06236 [Rhinocladiella mackenziei CBS 650.93]